MNTDLKKTNDIHQILTVTYLEIFFEGVRAMFYGLHYDDEVFDMYYGMQSTTEEIEKVLGCVYVGPNTKVYEIPPGLKEPNDNNNGL